MSDELPLFLSLPGKLRQLADELMGDGNKILTHAPGFQARWFGVFYSLYVHGPQSVTGVAGRLGVTHPAVNKTAGELIAAGLVAPYRDRGDKRRRLLALTSTGKSVARELEPHWQLVEANLKQQAPASG